MFQPTEEQKRVINSDNKHILVSASAGTGKTTVMINRILRLLKEEKVRPENLLVITFTTAAASEMKERLSVAVANEPSMRHLLPSLSSATIGTIHSFCAKLVRQFFYITGIDPNFSVMDEWKASAMKKRVLDKILSEYYAADDEIFYELIKITGKRNDERLAEILLELLSFRECIPNFEEYLEKSSDYVSIFDLCMDLLLKEALSTVDYYKNKAEKIISQPENKDTKAYALFSSFFDALNINYRYDIFELKKYFQEIKFPQARKSTKNTDFDNNLIDLYKDIKNAFQYDIKKTFEVIKGMTKRGAFMRFARGYIFCDKLIEIFNKFDEAYKKEKKDLGQLDFTSLEGYAMQLLKDPEALSNIENQYKYIFVDEYQDVNDVQEFIISAICKNASSFMVGDVKQCIYGFRMSEPDNFRKRRTYCQQNGGEAHNLTGNFRSDNAILSFVNRVFSPVMTESFGGSDYENEAQLTGSFSLSENISGVHILRYEKKEREAIKPSEKIRNGEIYKIDSEEYSQNPEGSIIAEKIREIVGSEIQLKDKTVRISFSDITVLARKKNTLSEIYDSLLHAGIPARLTFNEEFLQGDEIKQIVSLLKILANHTDNLSMFNVLTGYFGGFTYNEINEINTLSNDECLFDKINALYETNEKCHNFINLFNKYKLVSLGTTADILVNNIVNLSGFRDYVMSLERASERISVVDAFLTAISEVFECRNLHGMLKFLDDCEMNGNMTNVNDINAVKLMTIHSSKGLEFPIVFIAGLNGKFNPDNKLIRFDKQGGIAIKCYDSKRKIILDNPVFYVNTMLKRKKDTEEELRLLYVATTRAKYSLFILNTDENKEEKRPETVTSADSWINNLIYTDDTIQQHLSNTVYSIEFLVSSDTTTKSLSLHKKYESKLKKLEFDNSPKIEEEVERIRKNYFPKKPYPEIPRKMVSSKLKKEFAQIEEDKSEVIISENDDYNKMFAHPYGNTENEVTQLKKNRLNTELGTAYHKILECIRLKPCELEEIKYHADKLLREGVVNCKIFEALDFNVILKTVRDKKMREVLDGCTLHFEKQFISRLQISELTDNSINENVMLQGAIDLIGIDKTNKRAVIIDYKYTGSTFNISERYHMQLYSYKIAVGKLLPQYTILTYIYALKQNELIKI